MQTKTTVFTVQQLRFLSEILGVSVEELMGSGADLNSLESVDERSPLDEQRR